MKISVCGKEQGSADAGNSKSSKDSCGPACGARAYGGSAAWSEAGSGEQYAGSGVEENLRDAGIDLA